MVEHNIAGIQYCNLMTGCIRSILLEIDPSNPLLLIQPPDVELSSDERRQSVAAPQTNTARVQKHAAPPHDSTLRKSRKTQYPPSNNTQELIKIVGDHDDQGKKLTSTKLSYRMFEFFRFRSLQSGKYVAVMVNPDLWVLARVVKDWNEITTYQQLVGLAEVERNALFKEKVYVRNAKDYNGTMEDTRDVNREHILPLPTSHAEANDWGSRMRKGSRVLAMYPGTTSFRHASVVDYTTFCRGDDDIIVVEFDQDGEDDNIPQHHIPARFMTLIPQELKGSKRRRKRRASTTAND